MTQESNTARTISVMRTGPLSWPFFGPVDKSRKGKNGSQFYKNWKNKTSDVNSTHASDPEDTFDAGKDEVEDAEPHDPVHHRPQTRPNTAQRRSSLVIDSKRRASDTDLRTWWCHSQDWRWWPAIGPKFSWEQRPAQQRSAGLELKGKDTNEDKWDFVLKRSHDPTLTSRAKSIGVFVFGTEDGHLHHPQENHPCDPELDPQQILPVARRPDKPKQAVEDVHDAHHHVELQTGTQKRSQGSVWVSWK